MEILPSEEGQNRDALKMTSTLPVSGLGPGQESHSPLTCRWSWAGQQELPTSTCHTSPSSPGQVERR